MGWAASEKTPMSGAQHPTALDSAFLSRQHPTGPLFTQHLLQNRFELSGSRYRSKNLILPGLAVSKELVEARSSRNPLNDPLLTESFWTS